MVHRRPCTQNHFYFFYNVPLATLQSFQGNKSYKWLWLPAVLFAHSPLLPIKVISIVFFFLVLLFEYLPDHFKQCQPACFRANWKANLFRCSKQGKRNFVPASVSKIILSPVLPQIFHPRAPKHSSVPTEIEILATSCAASPIDPFNSSAPIHSAPPWNSP